MSRIVKYDFAGSFDEAAMESLLQRAKNLGIVQEYDTGRGTLVWFEGRPGGRLRAIREEVGKLMAQGEAR